MTRLIKVFVVALALALVAAAQDIPKVETFAGYTFLRVNSSNNNPNFSANGGSAQLVYNFNGAFGWVTDIGAVHNGNISGKHLDTTFTNFLWGPRFSIRKHSRVVPYLNVLLGGVHAGTSTAVDVTIPPQATNPIYIPGTGNVVAGQQVSLRAVSSQTAFAMAAGGGIDVKINKHVSFRPVGMDYFLTRLQNIRSLQDNNQHSFRYTAGFNFTLGAQ